MFLDAIASPSTYPCQLAVGESDSQSLIVPDLEIPIASPSFVSLLSLISHWQHLEVLVQPVAVGICPTQLSLLLAPAGKEKVLSFQFPQY